jgi:hypothetical protein
MRTLLHTPPSKPLWVLTALATLVTIGFLAYFRLSEGALAPYGSVPFQWAWTPAQAQKMRTTWGAAGDAVARRSLWVDFAFMPVYVVCFAGWAVLAARSLTGRLQTLGLQLALAPWLAWALDATENLMLLRVLDTAGSPPALPLLVAGTASVLKFALLILCGLYSLGTGVYHLWRHLR